jgi:Mobilization protein NikA
MPRCESSSATTAWSRSRVRAAAGRPGTIPRVTARSRRYSFPGRDHRTHVRFTADEYAELAAAATRAGLTTTGYVGKRRWRQRGA